MEAKLRNWHTLKYAILMVSSFVEGEESFNPAASLQWQLVVVSVR